MSADKRRSQRRDNSPKFGDEDNAGIEDVYYTANQDPEADKNIGNKEKGRDRRPG